MRGALSGRWPRWAPPALVVAVLVLDTVQRARSWPVVVVGLLDEPAHLATALLGLGALAPLRMSRRAWWAALVAAVAIDVDHIPLYLTDGAFAVGGGRPPTHCLLTVAVAAALPFLLRERWLLGVAAGLVLHLARDAATGPGVPLLWPADATAVLIPYPLYAAVLVVFAGVAYARRCAASRAAVRWADPGPATPPRVGQAGRPSSAPQTPGDPCDECSHPRRATG